MGLFTMFSKHNKQDDKNKFPWILLNDINQLDEIQQNINNVDIIFKHSTRCEISRIVISKFQKKHQDNTFNCSFYYLDLLNYRSLSNKIAERFKIVHQSPQLIVIEKGKLKIHASHFDILDIDLIF